MVLMYGGSGGGRGSNGGVVVDGGVTAFGDGVVTAGGV